MKAQMKLWLMLEDISDEGNFMSESEVAHILIVNVKILIQLGYNFHE